MRYFLARRPVTAAVRHVGQGRLYLPIVSGLGAAKDLRNTRRAARQVSNDAFSGGTLEIQTATTAHSNSTPKVAAPACGEGHRGTHGWRGAHQTKRAASMCSFGAQYIAAPFASSTVKNVTAQSQRHRTDF